MILLMGFERTTWTFPTRNLNNHKQDTNLRVVLKIRPIGLCPPLNGVLMNSYCSRPWIEVQCARVNSSSCPLQVPCWLIFSVCFLLEKLEIPFHKVSFNQLIFLKLLFEFFSPSFLSFIDCLSWLFIFIFSCF